ncbi:hypothetical protein V2J09_019538 [Rumex salicifolius]
MLRMGKRESESIEIEFATSVAAAAFAVHSLEETKTNYQKKMMASFRAKERSETSKPVSRRGSLKIDDIHDNNSMTRRRSSENEVRVLGREIMVRTNSIRSAEDRTGEEQRRVLTKAETWERDELNKIDKRYRIMISDITKWENERKIKAKLVMEKRKAEVERLRKLTSLHYQRKTKWIDSVASGAKTHLQEKKRSEESNVKAKARKIRSTGKLPIKCFCFEYYR